MRTNSDGEFLLLCIDDVAADIAMEMAVMIMITVYKTTGIGKKKVSRMSIPKSREISATLL